MKNVLASVSALWFATLAVSLAPGCRTDDRAIIHGAKLPIGPHPEADRKTAVPRVTISWEQVDIEDALRWCVRQGPVTLLYEGSLVGKVTIVTSNAPLDRIISDILSTNGYGVVQWFGINVIRTQRQLAHDGMKSAGPLFEAPSGDDTIIDGGGFQNESADFALRAILPVVGIEADIEPCDVKVTLLAPASGTEASRLLNAILRLAGQEMVIRKKRQPNKAPATR